MTDFYSQVPKTLVENLEYRRDLLAWADTPKKQRTLWTACNRDVLYFVNTFCWLYEPRASKLRGTTSKIIPFITYEYQDEAFLKMDESLGVCDVGVEKSRDLGATWMFLTLYFYHWVFNPFSSFGLMSRNQDLVDKPGKKDTLMWKLDFLLRGEGGKGGLPIWMRPKNVYRTNLLMENRDNGSTFEGSATTGDAFRGGRKTSIGMDEFASFSKGDDYEAQAATQHATDSRFFVSTPKGASGAYYDVMHEPSSMVKIILDWRSHPDRKLGLYQGKDGDLEILDKDYKFPEDYKHLMDGKVRSPYYDAECARPGATPQSIAQELDRDYGGSEYQLFGIELYEAATPNIMSPFRRGIFGYDAESLEPRFATSDDGPMKLWCHMPDEMPIRDQKYIVGCDISAGLGGSHTSNSVIIVLGATSYEQVAEYATNTTKPDDFADLAISVCKWFGGAYLIWEINGAPGSAFTRRVLNQNYGNIFYREVEQRNFKKKTKNPGWFSSEKTKPAVLTEMGHAIKSGELVLRSDKLINECRQYVYKEGKIVHSRSVKTQDDSSKGQAHGDRVIAASLAWHATKDRIPEKKSEDLNHKIPFGSMAWRMQEHENKLELVKDDGWD